MKKVMIVTLLIALIFAGLLLGPALVEYDGYVLVVMENGTLQLRVFGVLLLSIVLVVLGWLFSWLIRKTYNIISGSHNWLWSWSSKKRQQAFTNGLLALAAGDYLDAQKQLAKIENEDFDGLNLLASAEIELQLGNSDKARDYWHQASTFPKAFVASQLNLIRDHLSTGNTSQAQVLIDTFDDKQKKLKSVVQISAQTLAQSGHWKTLENNLPKWKRVLGKDYQTWREKASQGTFAEVASKEGAMQLKQNWKALPRLTRKDTAQQTAYVQQLLNQEMHIDAQSALVEFQKSGPVPSLVSLFRQLKSRHPESAIKLIEGWLKKDELNTELYSVLGQIAFNSDDLVLAEKALAKAIKLGNKKQDLLLMASIKERQQDSVGALEFYKESVVLKE